MIDEHLPAFLRRFPGNLAQSPDNPVQRERLPDDAEVELDYPVYQDPYPSTLRQLLLLATTASLAAPLLAWTGHLVPVPLIDGGLNAIALMLAAAVVVRGALASRWPLGSVGAAVAALPATAFLVREAPLAIVSGAIGAAGVAILADRLAEGYWRFKTAAPAPRETSRHVRTLWQRRWRWRSRPLQGTELYLLGFLVLLPVAWLVLFQIARTLGFGGFWETLAVYGGAVLIGLGWHVVVDRLAVLLYRRRPVPLRVASAATLRALVGWVSYNRRGAVGAGVHRHPAGPCAVRRLHLVGVIVAAGCLWSGLQLFRMPSFPEILKAAVASNPFLAVELDAKNREKASPVIPDVPFTEAEKQYMAQLSPGQREAYFVDRTARIVVAAAKQAKADDEDAARATTNQLLVDFFSAAARVAVRVVAPSAAVLAALFSLLVAIIGRACAGCETCFSAAAPERVFTSENWEHLVERVRGSGDKHESASVLWGVNARDDTPVLVPRKVFGEHLHVLGDSGSGKTSRGIMPLVAQLMRSGDASVIVVDLKADELSLFAGLEKEATAITARLKRENPDSPGYPMRWFTTVLDRSSFVFNPFAQRAMAKLSAEQKTDILIAALGLNYGTDYGRKFYGDANYDVLQYAMQEFPQIGSFAELADVLARADSFPLPTKTREAASNVASSVRRLARFPALNASSQAGTPQSVLDNTIDLTDLLTTPQALYVAMPPTAGISNTA